MRNGMTTRQGIYVVIENNTKLPNTISEAVPLYPKSSTELGLTLKKLLRLKEPYPSKCIDNYPEMFKNTAVAGNLNFTYSEKTCRSMCSNFFINKFCGCYYPQIIEGVIDMDQFSNSSFCDSDIPKKHPCIIKSQMVSSESSSDGINACQCFPECTQSLYQVHILNHFIISSIFDILR